MCGDCRPGRRAVCGGQGLTRASPQRVTSKRVLGDRRSSERSALTWSPVSSPTACVPPARTLVILVTGARLCSQTGTRAANSKPGPFRISVSHLMHPLGAQGGASWWAGDFKSSSPFHSLTAEGQGFWKPGAGAGAQGLELPDLTFILAPPAFSL